jgi:GDP-L-fucose synthase
VIPALVRKCVEARIRGDQQIAAWGTGSASREFLYAGDCAEGVVLAMERYDKPDPINLGNGREIRIKELTELVARLAGFEGRIVWDPTKPDGQPRRCLDVSAAEREMGFVARTPFEEGLKQTIAWYEQNRERIVSR